MTRTAIRLLFDVAITQAVLLIGHCNGTEGAVLADTVIAFGALLGPLKALHPHLRNGDAIIQVVCASLPVFIGGDRKVVRYDLIHRVVEPLLAARLAFDPSPPVPTASPAAGLPEKDLALTPK